LEKGARAGQPLRLIQVLGVSTANNSCETTVKSEPQNIEYRISNVEVWNRYAQSLLKWTEFIYSTFDVERSMFISFLHDQTGRLWGQRLG
jgi:hypothetical protein